MNVAGQPADTLVPTPAGFRRLGDLSAGEELFGSDGLPTPTVAVTGAGTLPVLRMRFDDGAQTVVTGGHLWLARDLFARNKALYRSSDIAANLLLPEGTPRWTVPPAERIEFPWTASLPLDPYTFGCQLRAGEIEEGIDLESYLTAGEEDRRDALDGLLGEMVSLPAAATPIALAAAASLIRSLGGLTIWIRYRSGPRMEPLWIDGGGLRRELVAVEDAGTAPCVSVSVAAADGLYVTGADFVLTCGATIPAQQGAAA